LKFSKQVERVIEDEHISVEELAEMIRRSAITSRSEGNRRFHDWVFCFDKERNCVNTMRKFTLSEVGQGSMKIEEECENCEGEGCKQCGWAGKVVRWFDV
jgi:hypothetical protein